MNYSGVSSRACEVCKGLSRGADDESRRKKVTEQITRPFQCNKFGSVGLQREGICRQFGKDSPKSYSLDAGMSSLESASLAPRQQGGECPSATPVLRTDRPEAAMAESGGTQSKIRKYCARRHERCRS